VGRAPAKKTKEKIDKLACVIAKMERGEWDWSDGKKHWSTDGGVRRPRVSKAEALRHVWGTVYNQLYSDIFPEKGRLHPIYEERLAFHRQRLDGGYRQALAELTDDGKALQVMSKKLYESLWWDLNDEETVRKIPFKDKAKFFEVLTKMEASIKGDVNTRGQERLHPNVVIQNINVPENVKKQMMEQFDIDGEAEEDEPIVEAPPEPDAP